MINNVILVGRLTRDLELKKTSNGKSVTAFSLAVQRDKDNADFVPCRAYNKTAELLTQYCRKGSQIGLKGSIRTYTTDKNGQKEYHTEVLADEITFLSSKEKQESVPVATSEEPSLVSVSDDDLPF